MELGCLRQAIRASRSHAPVAVAVETIRATFGLGSLTRLSVIGRPSASSRMSPGTLFSDSEKYDEISKREATAFRRAYSRRLKLALRTSGSGCSFLPWQTAKSAAGGYESCGNHPEATDSLTGATKEWATPQAERVTWRMDTPHTEGGGNKSLGMDIANWGTPSQNDPKGSSQPGQRRGQLTEHAETIFPSSLPPETTTSDGSELSPSIPGSPPPSGRRKLNPDFVEWLMGLPPLWTLHWPSSGTPVCGPAEMESWWRRRRQRLCNYLWRLLKH